MQAKSKYVGCPVVNADRQKASWVLEGEGHDLTTKSLFLDRIKSA